MFGKEKHIRSRFSKQCEARAEKALIKGRKKKKAKKTNATKNKKSKPRERPEGSLNKDKNELKLSAELPANQWVIGEVGEVDKKVCGSQLLGIGWAFWTQSSGFNGTSQ